MELYTAGSFGTLAGCVGIVYAMSASILGKEAGHCDRRIVLFFSMVVSLLGLAITRSYGGESLAEWIPWVIAFFNGFLICSTAIGASIATVNLRKKAADKVTGPSPTGARKIARRLMMTKL